MKKSILLLALFFIVICVNTNAQKFYYEGGYFEKVGSKWYEYKPSQQDGVWNQFTEVDDQENFYVIDNGLCQVAVPKSTSYDFLIKLKSETEWKFKYKSAHSQSTSRASAIHARLQELVDEQNALLKKTPIAIGGMNVEGLELSEESKTVYFGLRDTKCKRKQFSESALSNWKSACKTALVEQLKSHSKTDEMTRLCIEGGYKICYMYCDKKYANLFIIKISPNEIK